MKRLLPILVACTHPAPVHNGLIAFPATAADGSQQLFTIEPDGTNQTQITSGGDNSMPSWSPDGKRLVYNAESPNQPAQLVIIDADGSHPQMLAQGVAPRWGASGLIAYSAPPAGASAAEIFVIDPAGGPSRQVTTGGDHYGRIHVAWSGDGTHLVYAQITPQDPASDDTSNGCPALTWQPEIWTIAVDGTDARQITMPGVATNVDAAGAMLNTAYDANAPSWSPISDDVAFWSGQESCFGQVWRAHADGTSRTQLTHAPLMSHNDDPSWAPDGTKLLFSTDRGGRPELWMMNADGSDEEFLAANRPGPGPGDASWQPVIDAN